MRLRLEMREMRLPESVDREQYLRDSRAQSHRNQHCPRMVVLAEIYSGLMMHLHCISLVQSVQRRQGTSSTLRQ